MSTRTLPQTSHEANKEMTYDLRAGHWAKIKEALGKVDSGLIYTDIAVLIGLDKHAVGRRLSELESMQAIYKTGEKRLTPSKRNAFVYKLTKSTPDEKIAKEVAYKPNELTAAEYATKIINKSFEQPVQQLF